MNLTKAIIVIVILVYAGALITYFVKPSEKIYIGEITTKQNDQRQTTYYQQKEPQKPQEPKTGLTPTTQTTEPYVSGISTEEQKLEKKGGKLHISFRITGFRKDARQYLPPIKLEDCKVQNTTVTFDLMAAMEEYQGSIDMEKYKQYINEEEMQKMNDEINKKIRDEMPKFCEPSTVLTSKDYGIKYCYGIIENIETTHNGLIVPELTQRGVKDLLFKGDTYSDEIEVENVLDIPAELAKGRYIVKITIIDKISWKETTFEKEFII